MVTLSHAVSGGGYAGVTAAGVTVSVEDTDRGLVVPARADGRRGAAAASTRWRWRRSRRGR